MELFTCQPTQEVCEDSFSPLTVHLTLTVLLVLLIQALTWCVARRLRRKR